MTFDMKHIFKYMTIGFVLGTCSFASFAQGYDPDHPTPTGLNVSKNVSGPDENNDYTITLETFAEGTSAVVSQSVPTDIILVLDTSSSMNSTNYTYKGRSMSRLAAMRLVVEEFAQTVYDNDANARSTDPNYAGDRMAIITYNRNATMVTDNWVYINQVVNKSGDTYSGTLITQIRGINYSSGTRPDHGLEMAIDRLLDGSPRSAREDANLVVLMFTDGYPTDQAGSGLGDANQSTQSVDHFDYPFAAKALYFGSRIKKDYGATLYTIGLITAVNRPNNPNANNAWQYRNYCRVLTMCDWISSNYPDADFDPDSITSLAIENGSYTGRNNSTVYTGNRVVRPWRNDWVYNSNGDVITLADFTPGTRASGDDVPEDGYSQVVDDATDFGEIFKSIAAASAGSASAAGADSQIRDVVSNSFVLPTGFNANSVTITTWDIKSDASGWENEQTATGVSTVITEVTGSDEEVRKELIIEGFDFSLDDEYDDEGFTVTPGNWVGKRYTDQTNYYYAGKKLVISFKIKANGEATGGEGTNTNHPDSGVYLVVKDDAGNPILDAEGNKQYTKVVDYPIPNTELPMVIKITKTGLKHGESATFEIHRAEPLKNSDGTYQTNALGKPLPNTATWKNWSKVILTNKGEDGDAVTKVLYALDPHYVYEVAEDDWAWSYTLTGTGTTLNTSEVEVNPFSFHNTPKQNVVKHAEAVTVNHFQGSETQAREEHYKSVGTIPKTPESK